MFLIAILMILIVYFGCISLHVYITDDREEKNQWNLIMGIGLLGSGFFKALQLLLK